MVIHQKVGTELQIICVEYWNFSISNKNDIDNSVSIFHEKYLLDLVGTFIVHKYTEKWKSCWCNDACI